MDDTSIATALAQVGSVALDPFGYFVGSASRVNGLGGDKPSHDPRYVFCAPYVAAGAGRASFAIQFKNLRARRGTLLLQVNMQLTDSVTAARISASQRIALARVIENGGRMDISFIAYRNATFAVLGYIHDDTDASADGLDVILTYPESTEDDHLLEATETVYRGERLGSAMMLTDMTAPTLAEPVSQLCTAAQLREPVFAEWREALAERALDGYRLWEQIYVLQAARRYGMLAKGARGLGLDAPAIGIAEIFARLGVLVTVTGSSTEIPVGTAVTTVAAEGCGVPSHLVNFDLLWSIGGLEAFVDYQGTLAWLRASMRCLRPGGLGIYLASLSRAPDRAGLLRSDVERIALTLIAHGHTVARIKFAVDLPVPAAEFGQADAAPFGLIVQRAVT